MCVALATCTTGVARNAFATERSARRAVSATVSRGRKPDGYAAPGTRPVARSQPIRLIEGSRDDSDSLPTPTIASSPDLDSPLPPEGANVSSAPIDLASALRLAGVQNLDLVVARQRVELAVADQQLAAAQILPSVNIGTNYDNHTGTLQQASGNILAVNRSALYAGAGTGAVAAGTVPIPGLQYNLNISESIYKYLVTRKRVDVSRHLQRAVENETLLRVALAYTDLLRAEGERSITILTRNDAREVARLTAAYAKTGEGRPADAERAATELARREEEVIAAQAHVGIASRKLAQILNLDTTIRLRPIESQVVPQPVVPSVVPLPELITLAMLHRPELHARRTEIEAALLELDSARLLPFSPQMLAGGSGGVFGGGSNLVSQPGSERFGVNPPAPRFGSFQGRTDVDLVLYWSLKNLGLGNKAMIDAARARSRGAQFDELATLDRVRKEVADAFIRTHSRFAEIDRLALGVQTGMRALQEDLIRVRGREGLPIEVLDSVRQLNRSRQEYLAAIVEYNEAQLELYVALGDPPADTLARPVPEDFTAPFNGDPSSN